MVEPSTKTSVLAPPLKASVSPVVRPEVIFTVIEVMGSGVASVTVTVGSMTTDPLPGVYYTDPPAPIVVATWLTSTVVVTAVETLLLARLSLTCQEIVRVFALPPAPGSDAVLL